MGLIPKTWNPVLSRTMLPSAMRGFFVEDDIASITAWAIHVNKLCLVGTAIYRLSVTGIGLKIGRVIWHKVCMGD